MRIFSLILLVGLACACARAEAGRAPVQVDMRNVDLRVSAGVTLHVRQMTGRFEAVGRPIAYLDDKRSYAVVVDSGEIGVDLASLNALMARNLGGERSNIDRLRVTIEEGALRQTGVIDAAVNVPFTSTAVVSATPDGRIRVTTRSVRGFGVPVTGLMKFLSLEMDDLVKIAPGAGVVADGNDLILDPSRLIPAPSVRGRVMAVRIEGGQLVQTFGASAKSIAARPLSPNHIYWRGGELSFGKLTMADTDLELVDMDPRDPFDFSVDEWNAQLVAGYSQTLPNRGLKAHMPDYGDLRAPRRVIARRETGDR